MSREEILQRTKVKVKELFLEELGESIFIKGLSAYAVTQLNNKLVNGKPTDDYYFDLIAQSIFTKDYEQLFTVEDAKELDPIIFNTLLLEIAEFNKLGDSESLNKARAELKNLKSSSTSS